MDRDRCDRLASGSFESGMMHDGCLHSHRHSHQVLYGHKHGHQKNKITQIATK